MYDSDDGIIFISIVLIVVILIGFIIFVFGAMDEESWTEAPNGCYVHTVKENHLNIPDKTTITTLCPVKEK